jgi:hypothetical protein
LDGILFNKALTKIICYPSGRKGASYFVPNGVTRIGEAAFSHCTNLCSISIPNTVYRIMARAFYGCTGLGSISIPDSVIRIDEAAFSGCTGLNSIILSRKTFIDTDAFYETPGSITYLEKVDRENVDDLFEMMEIFRAKIHGGYILKANYFNELMEIAGTIYEKGDDNDREKIPVLIDLIEKEYRQSDLHKRRKY